MSPKPFTWEKSSHDACNKDERVVKPAPTNFSTRVSPIPSISKPAIKDAKVIVLLA